MQTDFRTWLFASPRRLVVVSLTAIILIFVAGSALFGNDGASGSSSDPAGSTPAAVSTSASVPESSGFVGAAVNFVKLWSQVQPGESRQQWLAKLTPLATQDYAKALTTTDTAALPGVPPTGEPSVRFLADDSAMIAVPLSNASSVLVTVVSGEGTSEPVVSDVQPNAGDD